MKCFKFSDILIDAVWFSPGYITINENGLIQAIDKKLPGNVEVEEVEGYCLPGIPNTHSHAFQYAMAGLSEHFVKDAKSDDFWSWREAMYQLALSITPEQMEAIASMLYLEMLRNGYTSVAEFHYVHHDKSGNHYANLSEMGEALLRAANKVGIQITLIPIFYQKGGFNKVAGNNQKRFILKNTDEYLALVESTKDSVNQFDNAKLGIGIHSLRAVEPDSIKKLLSTVNQNLPVHIHVAEQLKEIEDSIAYSGLRPVEWLLENVNLTDKFHLVHATHLIDKEIKGIAVAKANVVLCPSTEGNLGDGLFPFKQYQKYDGFWSIGTDSHIGLNPFEELRLLDYGQRLINHKRNTFYSEIHKDGSLYALKNVVLNGNKAMGNECHSFFQIGLPLNAMIINKDTPLLNQTSPEKLLSTIMYCTNSVNVLGTIVAGKWSVKNQELCNEYDVKKDFFNVIKELSIR